MPEGGWTLQRKVARTVLDNAILTEQQQETIRELHTLSPETWTRSRLSKAFKVRQVVDVVLLLVVLVALVEVVALSFFWLEQ